MAQDTSTPKFKVGDIVTYCPGAGRVEPGKGNKPLGIANCKVTETGRTHAGEECYKLEHWIFDRDYSGAIWAVVWDIEPPKE